MVFCVVLCCVGGELCWFALVCVELWCVCWCALSSVVAVLYFVVLCCVVLVCVLWCLCAAMCWFVLVCAVLCCGVLLSVALLYVGV